MQCSYMPSLEILKRKRLIDLDIRIALFQQFCLVFEMREIILELMFKEKYRSKNFHSSVNSTRRFNRFLLTFQDIQVGLEYIPCYKIEQRNCRSYSSAVQLKMNKFVKGRSVISVTTSDKTKKPVQRVPYLGSTCNGSLFWEPAEHVLERLG